MKKIVCWSLVAAALIGVCDNAEGMKRSRCQRSEHRKFDEVPVQQTQDVVKLKALVSTLKNTNKLLKKRMRLTKTSAKRSQLEAKKEISGLRDELRDRQDECERLRDELKTAQKRISGLEKAVNDAWNKCEELAAELQQRPPLNDKWSSDEDSDLSEKDSASSDDDIDELLPNTQPTPLGVRVKNTGTPNESEK